MQRGIIAATALFFIFSAGIVHSYTYKWKDEKGSVHFTDDYSRVPEKYRHRIKKFKETEHLEIDDKIREEIVREKKEVLEKEAVEEGKSESEDIVKIIKINPSTDRKGDIVFSGRVKNSGESPATSVKLSFTLLDNASEKIDVISHPLELVDNVLRPGEESAFHITTSIPFSTVASFNYNVEWRGFK